MRDEQIQHNVGRSARFNSHGIELIIWSKFLRYFSLPPLTTMTSSTFVSNSIDKLCPHAHAPLREKLQTNELRKINTVMSTDLARIGTLEGRDNAVSDAETVLLDNGHKTGAAQRKQASFRRVAGKVVGAVRFESAMRSAQERGQWAVQQSPPGEQHNDADGNTADQVRVRV